MFQKNPEERWFSSSGATVASIVAILALLLVVNGLNFLGQKPPNTSMRTLAEPYLNERHAIQQEIQIRGLAAQEGTWRTAYALTIATFLQLLIVTYTFFLVFKTLASTNKALAAANLTLSQAKETTRQAASATKIAAQTEKSSKSSAQAHVFVTVEFRLLKALAMRESSNIFRYIEPIVAISNFGGTPARDISVRVEFEQLPGKDYENQPIFTGIATRNFTVLPVSVNGSNTKIQLPTPRDAIGSSVSVDCDFYIVRTKVKYKTIFDYPNAPFIEDQLVHRATFHQINLTNQGVVEYGVPDVESVVTAA